MARDKVHNAVKQALITDGWAITHDPYVIETKDVDFEVDLGQKKFWARKKRVKK
jgi:XisH protein